jgi:hypothetical protein
MLIYSELLILGFVTYISETYVDSYDKAGYMGLEFMKWRMVKNIDNQFWLFYMLPNTVLYNG